MENQMSINDEIFDLLLKEALIEKYSRDVKAAMENAKPHDFSPEFEKKIRKIARSIGRKERMKNAGRFSLKFFVTIATIMGIAFGGLLTQPTVYAAVTNVIRSVFDKFDRYDFSSDNIGLSVDNFDDTIRLKYVPEGFRLASGFYTPAYVQLSYNDFYDEDRKIYFSYAIADGYGIDIDNEQHIYRSFYLGDTEYHLYESNDDNFRTIIMWYNNGYVFTISAHMSNDELIKMAESIK